MKIKEIKLDADGNVVLQDGLPVYIYEDGSESPLDAGKTINNLNNRILNLEDEKERHQNNVKKLKKEFKDLDPEKAREALETVANLKDKEILDSSGVKALKNEMRESFAQEREGLINTHNQAMDEQKTIISEQAETIRHLMISTEFAKHPFFSGEKPKTIYPPDDAIAIFGSKFKVQGNGKAVKIVAMGKDGEVMMSKKNHGEPADFNEAITVFVDEHPQKSRILNTGGRGAAGGTGHVGAGTDDDSQVTGVGRIKKGLEQHPSTSTLS